MVNYDLLRDSYKEKKVLITGHTGFKGSWLILVLKGFGARLYGFSIRTNENNLIYNDEISALLEKERISDILNYESLNEFIFEIQPEYIFHLAAQPLVSNSYFDPLTTINTNVFGLANLLQISAKIISLKSLLVITTDKVYFNDESGVKYKESDRLGGKDIYSGSKAAAEIITESFYHTFYKNTDTRILTVRSGNVIGGGDFAENRIVPDIIKSIMNSKRIKIRSPQSVRPWLHVLDSLFAYCYLAQINVKSIEMPKFNVAPRDTNKSVMDLIEYSKNYFPDLAVEYDMKTKFNESVNLNLDATLITSLGFNVKLNFENSIDMTLAWYKGFLNGKRPYDLCINDIYKYMSRNDY